MEHYCDIQIKSKKYLTGEVFINLDQNYKKKKCKNHFTGD